MMQQQLADQRKSTRLKKKKMMKMRSLVGPPAAAAAPGIQAPEGASSTWSATRVVAHIQSHLHTSRIEGFLSRSIHPSPSP